jgi:hypothetical protein
MTWRCFDKGYTIMHAIIISLALLAGGFTARSSAGGDKPGGQEQAVEDTRLHSELLMELVFERGLTSKVGSPGLSRSIVSVSGGTFEGPGLMGTILNPSGDWIVTRPDSSSLLDMRMVLKTVDSATIYMTCRGIAYTQADGRPFARILPMFETGSPKYAWLNKLVAVGVYRPLTGKIAYRIYKIL